MCPWHAVSMILQNAIRAEVDIDGRKVNVFALVLGRCARFQRIDLDDYLMSMAGMNSQADEF